MQYRPTYIHTYTVLLLLLMMMLLMLMLMCRCLNLHIRRRRKKVRWLMHTTQQATCRGCTSLAADRPAWRRRHTRHTDHIEFSQPDQRRCVAAAARAPGRPASIKVGSHYCERPSASLDTSYVLTTHKIPYVLFMEVSVVCFLAVASSSVVETCARVVAITLRLWYFGHVMWHMHTFIMWIGWLRNGSERGTLHKSAAKKNFRKWYRWMAWQLFYALLMQNGRYSRDIKLFIIIIISSSFICS